MKVLPKAASPVHKGYQAKTAAPQKPFDIYNFPAPTRGWVLNENLALAQPGGAYVLDNFFPTTNALRVRGGSPQFARVATGAPCYSFIRYNNGVAQKHFAASATAIYDITTVADEDTIPTTAAIMGQTAGYYSHLQFGTTGGEFTVIANGADVMWYFTGSAWYPINSAAIRTLNYDGGTTAFARGHTVTGGTSGASALIVAVNGTTAAGTLYIGPVTAGPFQDNEAITSASGAALVNGADVAGSSITITGVDTENISQIWSYGSRIFMVEQGTKTAHYLPSSALGGAVGQVELSGVFKLGGSLLFGATWSQDSGAGLDDKCLFVSTEGEVAVYEGTDPGDAPNNWRIVGVYQITRPLGINGTMLAGGDLLVAAEAGLVPISEAIRKDVAALSLSAVSRNIEPAWRQEVSDRRSLPWEIMKWPERSMMVVSLPRPDEGSLGRCFVANVETGAWCRYTGWDTRCMSCFDGQGYFGTNDGAIHTMELSGKDGALPYTCVYVGEFDHLNSPGVTKTAHQVRAVFLAESPFLPKLSASINYSITLPTAPNSTPDYVTAQWDTGAEWDNSVSWDTPDGATVSATRWVSIGRTGFAIAPQIQITFGIDPTPFVELVAFDMTYSSGGVVV